ncbi:hypothetical protein SHELI_v1c00940 [Spiroplasma helicoides]|uniref:EAL domain-containing protein n=1 Tax=Spiroplasma helicoides TaxID=216938 RepID=A0A1B3SJE5_9MOLU|nr:EAL domain-containing protein [Spiroplasma helicoides]AOG60049.1 hypothetical protein SHELI_v1c00940 [Spiroplasma helicoides]
MNILSSIIACLSYTAITAIVYTITWGLSRHIFERVKIYYELTLGVIFGVISMFGVIILTISANGNQNSLLTILLPIFLFWTCLLFISIYASLGVFVCNILGLTVFPNLFPQYYGSLNNLEIKIIVGISYSVAFAMYLINYFTKKGTPWSAWSITTIASLATALACVLPNIQQSGVIDFLVTILLWLGIGYLTYAYISMINQIHKHAIQLQNVVSYDHKFYLNQASAHDEILRYIHEEKTRYGAYFTFYISNYDMFEKKVSNSIREAVVSEIAKQAHDEFLKSFSEAIFFKPNYKTFGVFIPFENILDLVGEDEQKTFLAKLSSCIGEVQSVYKFEKFKVSIKIKGIVSLYGIQSSSLETLFDYNVVMQRLFSSNEFKNVTIVDPMKVMNEKNKNKKILTLNEIVSLNNCVSVFQPIYNGSTKNFDFFYLNNSIDGIEVNSSLFEPRWEVIKKYGLVSLFLRYLALNSAKSIAKYKNQNYINVINYDSIFVSSDGFDYEVFILKLRSLKINLNTLVLNFNITEEVENKKMLESNINSLKKSGIKISISEFGSEFTDYNLISIYKPDYLFMDRTIAKKINFVKEVETLVKNLVNIAKKIEGKLVATNVDTYMMFKTLKQTGVKYFEGSLIGHSLEPQQTIDPELKYLLSK